MKRPILFWSLALLGVMLAGTVLAGYVTGGAVIVRQPVDEDFYAVGRTVDLLAAVEGDLVVAARSVVVAAPVSMDVIAAAETVHLDAPVGDDVRAAGRAVWLNNAVSGHVVAAGDEVRLNRNASIGDWAWFAGRNVRIDGQIGRQLRVAAGTVTISGRIEGDAELRADRLELAPGAHIEGDLVFVSARQPVIADGAVVTGEVIVRLVEKREPRPWAGIAGGLFAGAVIVVTAVVVYLLFPPFTVSAADHLRQTPLKSLGLGIAVVAGTPLVIVLLFVTGVGALLALALLAGYLIWLLAGVIVSNVFVAAMGMRLAGKGESTRRALWALAVALAVVVVLVVGLVPVLGGLLVFLLFLFGLGAATLQLWRRYAGAAPA